MKKSNEKGVTLVSLAITVIVLMILASITTYSGLSTIKSSKFNEFKQELEIMQAEVNILYEKYKDYEIIPVGTDLLSTSQEVQENANKIFSELQETDTSNYKVFDHEVISSLGIEGIDREFLVDVKQRKVISLENFKYKGETYYTLSQLDSPWNVPNNVTSGSITFNLSSQNLTNNQWLIIVSNIQFSKYVGKGTVQYKINTNPYKTVGQDITSEEDFSFIVDKQGTYTIKLTDAAGVTLEKTITI